MKCKKVLRLIPAYLDDSLVWREAAEIAHHLEDCAACQRELDELRALQRVMQRLDRQKPPPDLGFRIRSATSEQGEWIPLKQIVGKFGDLVSPLAVPAFSGVVLTGLAFVALLSTLFTGASLGAGDQDAALGLFTEPRARSLAMLPVVSGENLAFMNQPVTVETLVGNDGRVIDYKVLSGPQDKQSLELLDQFLHFGVYMAPATFLGRPTVGTLVMTLSFYPTTNDRIDVSG